MKKRTRSILEELNSVHGTRDNERLIESTANNIIESSINLLSRIHEQFDIDNFNSFIVYNIYMWYALNTVIGFLNNEKTN